MKRCINVGLALIITMTLTSCASMEERWQEQYDLGIRYLAEGNYEEAIIAFTEAIEIDEKRPDSYFSRGQAYHSLSGALKENVDAEILRDFASEKEKLEFCYEQAIQDYKKAIELNPEGVEYYDELMLAALEYGDIDLMLEYGSLKYQNVKDSGLRDIFENAAKGLDLMDQLAETFLKEDDNAIFGLMQGDSYRALLSLQEYLKRPILREYGGKTLGLYRVDDPTYGHCMIYYGDCVDGLRDGEGAWYGYYDGNNYASRGDWSLDMPNGSFETKEWNSRLAESVVFRLVSGRVDSGLWNGTVIWAFEQENEYQSWDCTFINGVGVIVDEWTNPEDGKTHYHWSTQTREGIVNALGPSEGTEKEPDGIAGFLPREMESSKGSGT